MSRKMYRKAGIKTKIMIFFIAGAIGCTTLTGCNSVPENKKVVLTTGLSDDELFQIDSEVCTKEEFMIYLTNVQKRYEKTYGTDVWNTDVSGNSLEERLKESVLSELEQIKIMNLMGQANQISLTADEEEQVQKAAQEYIQTLTDDEKNILGISENQIADMYREYEIANKVYSTIIGNVNPEISDDDARIITVEQIGIKTYKTDSAGNQIELSDDEKQNAYQKIEEAYQEYLSGEDFDTLIDSYSNISESTVSFGHGEKEEAYEEAAFNLAEDEVSDVIETSDGYYLLKCVSVFDRDETDANKAKILEQRKKDAFNEAYDTFNADVTKEMNNDLWEKITFLSDDRVDTSEFFSIFDDNFDLEDE